MMSLDQMITDLQKGNWEMDGLEMTLTQNDIPDPIIYSGPGYLRQHPDGSLHFRIYTVTPNHVGIDEGFGHLGIAGRLIESHKYYTLKARMHDGLTWTSDYIIPKIERLFSASGIESIVGGDIEEISTSDINFPHKGYGLDLIYFCDLEIPCNGTTTTTTDTGRGPARRSFRFDNASCETEFGKVMVFKAEGSLTLSIDSENPLPVLFESRITESLGLILATHLRWNVLLLNTDGNLTIRVRSKKQTRRPYFHRPVGDRRGRGASDDAWSLFAKYLSLIAAHNENEYHPVTKQLFAVFDSDAGGIAATALTLGVAVEGVLNALYKEEGPPMEEMKVIVPLLTAHVLAWEGLTEADLGKSLRNRLPGLIGQLNQVSAKERLCVLIGKNAIDLDHVRAWGKLRNRAAHGATPGSRSYQELVDLRGKVTMLLYCLIFYKCGYTGKYDNYGTHEYPTEQYPGRLQTDVVSE